MGKITTYSIYHIQNEETVRFFMKICENILQNLNPMHTHSAYMNSKCYQNILLNLVCHVVKFNTRFNQNDYHLQNIFCILDFFQFIYLSCHQSHLHKNIPFAYKTNHVYKYIYREFKKKCDQWHIGRFLYLFCFNSHDCQYY